MEKDLLRKVQLELLEIAKEIKRVCDLLGICYFLDSGTLLGAVRHEGFIPWDDDLDIGMMRADYERFIKEAPQYLDQKYFLQTWESDSEYGLAFAKVRENNTVYKEKGAGISKAHNGFYVDVFPYDVYPQKFSQRKKQGSCYYIIRRMILSKCGYRPWSAEKNSLKKVAKHICYLPIEFVSCFISKEKLINTYLNTCTAYNNYYTGFVYEQAGAAHYGKWVLPSECFDEYIALKFEDTEFNCPAKYDLYLSSVYGDYMKLPPEEQRENRHQIVEIVFADR